MQVFENFISYRRSESTYVVKNIYDELQRNGFTTFCDIYSLGAGEFNKDLITAIDNCTNFILVLGRHSMDRCSEDDDWLRREIREALEKKKNIICVFSEDFVFPHNLPSDIDNIRNYNGLKFNISYWDRFIDDLISKFMISEINRLESDEERDFIIIQDTLVKYVGIARNVYIPNNVKIIGKDAFKNQTKITKVVIPESVEQIQESAFERCIQIPYIILPNSLKSIGNKAFCRCYNLAYIALNDALKEIGDEAFGFCAKLKVISIKKELEKIAPTAFNNCSQLMEFSIPDGNDYYSVKEGILYDYDIKRVIRCPENYKHDVVSLPQTVATIGEWCFSRCLKLIDVVLPKMLENVCAHAFNDCCNISSITLGDNIKKFDISALDGWNEHQRVIMGHKFHPVIKYEIEKRISELEPVEDQITDYKFCLIKTAFESEEEAIIVAKMLLDNSLIVSGQIKKMRSLYMWENELCNEKEVELTCFTESRLYTEVEKFITSHHSYELCQLICLPITNISKEFGDWIYAYTGKIKFED